MLDLPQLSAAQKAGDALVADLTDNEKIILVAYCDMATGELLKMGLQHKATSKDLIRNGVLLGVSLGLQLKIKNDGVERRNG